MSQPTWTLGQDDCAYLDTGSKWCHSLPGSGHRVEVIVRGLTRHIWSLTLQVTVQTNNPRHVWKSKSFKTDEGAVRCVVLCVHLYSHVSSMDWLAFTEQVVSVGGQTVSGAEWACVWLNCRTRTKDKTSTTNLKRIDYVHNYLSALHVYYLSALHVFSEKYWHK